MKFSPVLKSLLINYFILSREVVGKGSCFGEGECGEKQSCEKSVPGIIFSTIAINTQNRSWWGLHWRARMEEFWGRVFQNRKEGFLNLLFSRCLPGQRPIPLSKILV